LPGQRPCEQSEYRGDDEREQPRSEYGSDEGDQLAPALVGHVGAEQEVDRHHGDAEQEEQNPNGADQGAYWVRREPDEETEKGAECEHAQDYPHGFDRSGEGTGSEKRADAAPCALLSYEGTKCRPCAGIARGQRE